MCILHYVPDNIAPDRDALRNGALNNPDGHGWAIASPEFEHVLVGHSLSMNEAISDFMDMRSVYMDGPALFHSRWATHGSVKEENCHPFYVANDKRTVLAHNGILPADAHPVKGDDRSDTRILADELLTERYAKLDRKGTRRALATWAGRGNKLLILTNDPKYRRNVYLVNAAAGTWDNETGMWHSNTSYLYAPTWKSSAYSWQGKYTAALTEGERGMIGAADDFQVEYDSEGREICWMCGDGILSEWTRYCNNSACESCGDCGEWFGDCLCLSTDEQPKITKYNSMFREAATGWDMG